MEIRAEINGRSTVLSGAADERLRDVLYRSGYVSLRDSDDREGFAGSDTIIFNDRPAYSNLILLYQAEGASIRTPESLLSGREISDVQQAIRIMRSRSEELGITKIGIAGNSAGGHLAASAATMYADSETRPDFQILMYPVITMEESFTNMLSRDALLGKNPPQDLIDRYSCEKHVTEDTPPAFIFLCSDDPDVKPQNSLRYYEQLLAHGVSASMHIYPSGGHGFGWKDSMPYKGCWVYELECWLRNVAGKL